MCQIYFSNILNHALLDVVVVLNSQRPTWNLFAGCSLYATGDSFPSFFLFLSLTPVYLFIVGRNGYCCTWSHSMTHTHIETFGSTLVDKTRCRDLHVVTHNTHNRQTFMLPTGFEPTFPASERTQTHALVRAVTGISRVQYVNSPTFFYL